MKKFLTVLVFLLPLSAMPETGVDSGGDSGATAAERKRAGPQRAVRAVYWKGGYMISEADVKPDPALGKEKKKKIKKKPVTAKK